MCFGSLHVVPINLWKLETFSGVKGLKQIFFLCQKESIVKINNKDPQIISVQSESIFQKELGVIISPKLSACTNA